MNDFGIWMNTIIEYPNKFLNCAGCLLWKPLGFRLTTYGFLSAHAIHIGSSLSTPLIFPLEKEERWFLHASPLLFPRREIFINKSWGLQEEPISSS